jgi:hypothetical protein
VSGVYPADVEVRRSARISDCGLYRYSLVRRWELNSKPPAQFVMLNPSTADADLDDPTIRRCVGFARALGCGGIIVVNLYGFRATKPADLWRAADPVGPDADDFLRVVARRSVSEGAPLIAAWGANAKPERVREAHEVIASAGAHLTALGVTKGGAPRHPLYLPATAAPTPWPTTDTSPSDGAREDRDR